jgi:S-methylmethionine-dependent homocysteine/selenocysteine methylase
MTYRDHLPQLDGGVFLTDGGIETVLIFHEGLDLPLFAAFHVLKDEAGSEKLRAYYEPYVALAREAELGFVLESATWRASPRWAAEIGYDAGQLDEMNRKAIALLEEIREREADGSAAIVISGCVGPQDDGYNPAELLSAEAAKSYHSTQIGTFADTAADMVTAITITYVEEAVGIVRAAGEHGMPVAISFTVETDGPCRAGRPSARRSSRSTPRPTPLRPTSWSTARTRPTSRGWLRAMEDGDGESGVCARTPRPRAMPSSTRQPSSTTGIPPTWPPAMRGYAERCRS